MQYAADQAIYWPRLLTAAAVDPILASALRELMQRGASLGFNERGGLQLGPGRMTQEEYNQFKAEYLMPRGEKLRNILRRARDGAHPWLTAVQQAYTDLDNRCARGEKALHAAAQAGNRERFKACLVQITDRHYQAHMIAQALFTAGYGAYEQAINAHWNGFMEHLQGIQQVKLPYQITGKAWPVETPDGWIWVVDVRTTPDGHPFEPESVNLGGDRGQKLRLSDEPILTDWDLANILAPFETDQWWREAG